MTLEHFRKLERMYLQANINTQFQESFKKPTINLGSGLIYDLTGTNGRQLIAFGDQPPVENENNGTNKTFNFYFNVLSQLGNILLCLG